MDDLKADLDPHRIPKHIAIIMDGNGRWAKTRSRHRVFGHKKGVESVRKITESAQELGVKYLTLYAFSTENWSRPKEEVTALMTLFIETLKLEINRLVKKGVRLKAIGDLENLPKDTYKALLNGIERTKENDKITLVLALNYSSKWEITKATKDISQKVVKGELSIDDIDDSLVERHLQTHGIPDPELMIRTSGEHRISNFLLWQLAYSEFYFTDTFWPDFRKEHLVAAISDFQNRERRFGKTSAQVTP